MESIRVACLLLGTMVLVGCGDGSIAPVKGRVTLDGQPITAGVVHFVPDSGPAASGVIDDEGVYRLSTHGKRDGAVIGPHKVYLAGPPTDLGGYSLDDYQENLEPQDQPPLAFPTRYLSPQTSGLQFEVAAGSNEIDIELAK